MVELSTGWQVRPVDGERALIIVGPGGVQRARLVDGGAVDPISAGFKLTPGGRRKLAEASQQSWRDAGRRLPHLHRAVLHLPDGTTTKVINPGGVTPGTFSTTLKLAGRRYRYKHVSADAAELDCDGDPLVVASQRPTRRGFGALQRAGHTAGVHLGLHRALDETDQLAVVVFTDALGPPGRPGLVRTVLSGIVDDALDRRDPPRR